MSGTVEDQDSALFDAVEERKPYETCPLCDGADTPFLLEGDCSQHACYQAPLRPIIRWHRCAACGHVFTEGYFTSAALKVLFSRTLDNQKLGAAFERERYVSARIIERVARRAPTGNWLDVGFGNGSLIFTADEFGYNAAGVDLRPDNAKALQNFGFAAHCADVADLAMPGHFSVVSMADVLEHMPFPRKGLAAAYELLQPGGVLFVSMPNMGAFAWRALDNARINPYWGEIEHYHNFTRTRLYSVLAEHGFTPVEYFVSERYRVCMEVIATRQ